jgi:predicted AAA+ superfamily ATPase
MEGTYLSLLNRQNVWWEGKIENDVHLAQWREHERRWIPLDLEGLPLESFSLNIVVGPRQAGKTTLLNAMSGVVPLKSGSVEYFNYITYLSPRPPLHICGSTLLTLQLCSG